MTTETINDYISILREELVPATGCTEPIALAYAAARLRDILGAVPEGIRAEISGNIIKNVKSVVVPNTGGRKGIPAAIAAGVVAGDASKVLQCIARVPAEKQGEIAAYAQNASMEIVCARTSRLLDIRLTGRAGGHTALVHIANSHSNIVREEKDGEILFQRPLTDSAEDSLTDKSALNVADILEFADTVDLEEVTPLLGQQVDCNTAIAREGLKNSWGANIGSTLLNNYPEDIRLEARAYAAAGSDARMSGCELPVVINSGSGNQGMTTSIPVIVYGQGIGASQEKIYRALVLANLVTVHQKTGIGRLSAYCGAVSAGAAAGAGIAYLDGGGYEAIIHTVVNALAIVSGIICDGAKASCAGKIAAAVEAGVLGCRMYQQNQQFYGGDGIITKGVEATLDNVGRLAKIGMHSTDKEILRIMLQQ